MKISKQFEELINKQIRENEKFELYTHVFKFNETDDEFYYYAVYKYYQEGRGHIVLSSKRGLIPKSEAVQIAYYFLTHNGTIVAAEGSISEVRKRKIEVINNILESFMKNKEIIFRNKNLITSYETVVETLQLQISNTEIVDEIYKKIKELELSIQKQTETLTEEKWKKGRELVQKYNVTMYQELKKVLQSWDDVADILSWLNNEKFDFLERTRIKKLIKQTKKIFNDESKAYFLKSLEGFEKDLQGNLLTKTRGELTSEEYIQITNEMMEKEYKENLLKDNRNP